MKKFQGFKTKEEAIKYLKKVLKWRRFIETHRKIKLALELLIN